jgi:hypothetical protein
MPDERAHPAVSRQRQYQLRMKRQGRCTVCGKPVAEGSRPICPEHLVRARKRKRQKQACKRRYSSALSYNVEPGKGVPDLPAQSASRSARVRLTFDTDGLEVALTCLSRGEITKLGLTISLQTFLTALTWMCSSNNAPLAGWLTVSLGNRSILCRVEGDLGDSATPKLMPASKKVPSVLRGAIQCLARSNLADEYPHP